MPLHRLYTLRKSEVEAIHKLLGGKYSYRERMGRGGTGSPFLYYIGGHPGIDELNERATDELRINFEEFKDGLMLGITERTEPYILPLLPEHVLSIKIRLKAEQTAPRKGSFFSWLLGRGVKLKTARYFAGSSEYEDARTEFELDTIECTIRAWKTAEEYGQLKAFFEKSIFTDKLELS